MRAYPLVFAHSIKYKQHIIIVGIFHLVCACFKRIGTKMDGTELSGVLLETSLITPGSLNGVMTGNLYSRTMNCHRVMVASLERLMNETCLARKEKSIFYPSRGIANPSKEGH